MDFKIYVQNAVASYVSRESRSILFIKHYNTLDITEDEILAQVDRIENQVFLYHEYRMHEMHNSYAPFLDWIRHCYNKYYKELMTVEEFLHSCSVYSMHVEILSGLIREDICSRKEDVLYFEIKYESFRMKTNILSILEYISKDHPLVFILSKLHLAPYSTINLLQSLVENTMNIHAVLMYNDEFNIMEYKKGVWNGLLQAAATQDLQLEWGRLDSEKTIDIQDEFWFDKEYTNEYFQQLQNMYYTFSLEDAYYYMNNILNRLDEKTIRFERNQHIQFLQLAAYINMNFGQNDMALVLCDKMTDMQCHRSEDRYLRYTYYYIYARAKMIASQPNHVKEYCEECMNLARMMNDNFLACKAQILLWSALSGMGKDIFEYKFSFVCDPNIVDQAKHYGFYNFVAYIYVFGFENDLKTITSVAKGEKELYYFNMGIKLGTELGNDNFLLNAYMKNIILYSRAGHHSFVRDMYKKRLAVLRRPNPLRESHMLAGLGYNSVILEEFEQAHSYLMESLLTLIKLEEPDDIMNSLYNLALVHFVAENHQNSASIVELILKMLKEMGYHSIRACSNIKLYSFIAISCYYQNEFYNSYYYLSKIETIVEHMIMVLESKDDGTWDEDLMLYHLVKGMMYNYENEFDLCLKEFDAVMKKVESYQGSKFFVIPIYAMELSSVYLKQGKIDESARAIDYGIEFCEKENIPRKKERLIYFKEHRERLTTPIMKKSDPLPLERIMQITRYAGTQLKLEKREKDIQFLTVLQDAISRENMTVDDLFFNTSAVIKNSYTLDEIIILRRRNGQREWLHDASFKKRSDEEFDKVFDFFHTYKQAFLANRIDKNFTQFLPLMSMFYDKPIMTMIGIPIMEETGTETVFLGYTKVRHRTVGSRTYLGNEDLMIFKFAFSQFCEMMRRIDSRNMIERMNQKLEQSAITDHLTGIMNRTGFSKQTEIICAQGNIKNNVLLYCDLDNFKYYNDTFGHDVGDLVLVTFAELIKRLSDRKGLAVRYGGDEFIVLLYNQTEQDGVDFAQQIYKEISGGFVDEIKHKLKQDIQIPDEKKISCSIGIAGFKGGSKAELQLALNRADQMLYYVKKHGKSTYKLYDPADVLE